MRQNRSVSGESMVRVADVSSIEASLLPDGVLDRPPFRATSVARFFGRATRRAVSFDT